METTEANSLLNSFVLPPYATIVTLISLLNISGLTDPVVRHCIMGLKVIVIIQIDTVYNIGTDLLEKKEFDTFFKWLPDIYFNNRESIPPVMIIDSIHQSIKADKVVRVDS